MHSRSPSKCPRGAVVETLAEHGFAVFAINPKQLDRFRDRYSPAGAKDDSRDAFVLADSLRTDRGIAARLRKLLDDLASPGPGEANEHRDAEVLLSLPGVGTTVAATMLSEASQAIADRDYHALRSYAGTAPITRQSGKKTVVLMRYSCNERLRNALYHWARVSTIRDPRSRAHYAGLRAKGHSHGRALRALADRWLRVLIAMLREGTLYDPNLQKAQHSDGRHP